MPTEQISTFSPVFRLGGDGEDTSAKMLHAPSTDLYILEGDCDYRQRPAVVEGSRLRELAEAIQAKVKRREEFDQKQWTVSVQDGPDACVRTFETQSQAREFVARLVLCGSGTKRSESK